MKRHKMTKRKIFEKFDNSSQDEFIAKTNKELYSKNNATTIVIKYCRGEKQEAKEKQMHLEEN